MFTCHDSGNSGPRGAAWNTGATKIFRQRCVWRFDRSLKENDVIRSTLSLRRVDPKNQAMKKGLTRPCISQRISFSCKRLAAKFAKASSDRTDEQHFEVSTWRFPSHSYSWRMCWSIFICLDNLCDLHCRAAATGEIPSGMVYAAYILSMLRSRVMCWLCGQQRSRFLNSRACRGYRRRRCASGWRLRLVRKGVELAQRLVDRY